MSKDGKRLFTTDGVSGTVSVIDTDNNEKIKVIKDIAAAAAGISILIWMIIFCVEVIN